MANDAKSSLSNFCLTNVRNHKAFLEVHGRDIDFAKLEQRYHLTSTDAEAAAVRLLLPLHRKRYIPESYSYAKDSSLAESSCLMLALAIDT